jgi:hypothetical protein
VHQILTNRRALPAVLPALGLAERTPPAIGRADPPGSALCHQFASGVDVIGQESVPELRVVAAGVE